MQEAGEPDALRLPPARKHRVHAGQVLLERAARVPDEIGAATCELAGDLGHPPVTLERNPHLRRHDRPYM